MHPTPLAAGGIHGITNSPRKVFDLLLVCFGSSRHDLLKISFVSAPAMIADDSVAVVVFLSN